MQAKQKTQTAKHCDKWKFAIGTTSRVPKSDRHYLIIDVDLMASDHDTKRITLIASYLCSIGITSWMFQKTPHGFHIYTGKTYAWSTLLRVMKSLRFIDRTWFSIGRSRGYFFLADKDLILLPWPVERMILHHGKER